MALLPVPDHYFVCRSGCMAPYFPTINQMGAYREEHYTSYAAMGLGF